MYLFRVEVVVCTKSDCHNVFDEILLSVCFYILRPTIISLGLTTGISRLTRRAQLCLQLSD